MLHIHKKARKFVVMSLRAPRDNLIRKNDLVIFGEAIKSV